MDYLRPLGAKSALYLLLTVSGSFFRPDYSDFDHLSLEARVAFKSYIGSSSIARAGVALEYRNYGNPLFDFLSQDFTASLDEFFPTNTTLKAGFGWGYKYFLHPYPALEPSQEPVTEGAAYGYGGPQGKGPRGEADTFSNQGPRAAARASRAFPYPAFWPRAWERGWASAYP